MTRLGLYLSVVLLLFTPASAMAAVVVSDNFDSYSTGSLNGDNGGTGWTAGWSASSATVEDTVLVSSPNGAFFQTNGGDDHNTRVFTTPMSVGIATFQGSISSASGELDFCLNSSTDNVICIRFDSTGHVIGYGPSFGSTIDAGTYTADAFHQVDIDFDNSTSDYRIRLDGGSWTSRIGYINGAELIDRLDLHKSDNTSGINTYFDDISIDDGTGGGGGGTSSTTATSTVSVDLTPISWGIGFFLFYLSMSFVLLYFKFTKHD